MNEGDYDKRRAIHLAACEGHVKVAEILIAQRADLNVQDRYNGTPLADALRHKQTEVGKLLRANGAELLFEDEAERLCVAAARSDGFADLRWLLDFGCDPTRKDYDARTPLHLAAAEGNVDSLKLLLDRQADVNAADRWGATPLQEAFRNDKTECIALLCEKGGELGLFDAPDELNSAAASGDVGRLQRLINVKCSANSTDYDGRSPLHLAASNGVVAAANFLLDMPDVDVNAEDRFGNTALDDAAREDAKNKGEGLHEVVRMLLIRKGGREGSHIAREIEQGDDLTQTLLRRQALVVQQQNVRAHRTSRNLPSLH